MAGYKLTAATEVWRWGLAGLAGLGGGGCGGVGVENSVFGGIWQIGKLDA